MIAYIPLVEDISLGYVRVKVKAWNIGNLPTRREVELLANTEDAYKVLLNNQIIERY